MELRNEVAQRIEPRLRMIYKGDGVVNARRALQASSLRTTAATPPRERTRAALPRWTGPARDVRVSAFVELKQDTDARAYARRGRLATTELPISALARLATRPDGIAYVETGATLEPPNPISNALHATAPPRRAVDPALRGERVMIGIVDVGGFDFAHPEFIRGGNTRFEAIWDQGLAPDGTGNVPYGRVITREHIDQALAWQKKPKGLAATELLEQSSRVAGSHATHVASIAAGATGVCPNAVIAGVTIAIPDDADERRRSFFDSTRLAHAVDFLDDLARRRNLPLVINISLGTNGHAHDGSSPINRWIERFLDDRGRCVVVAAGNAGQERPHFGGDLGFLSGRIHAAGRIDAVGLEADLEWDVLGGDAEDLSENEMEIWYEPQDDLEVEVRAPGQTTWLGPIGPGRFLQNHLLPNGTLVSIYNERYHPANGTNRISVFLSPRLRQPIAGVAAGRWTVRLRGRTIRDGRFHAWIERDDPRPVRILGLSGPQGTARWAFPSLFSEASNVDQSSVTSLGCSERVITVANYDAIREQVHPSSSQGPTRTGGFKPEVAAAGTDIIAANGFGHPSHPYVSKTGTSMASPYVAGVAAAMLARERNLNASQIIGIMRRTAQPLPGSNYRWQDAAGFGRIRPRKCLDEVPATFRERDHDDEVATTGGAG